jgi:PKD domain
MRPIKYIIIALAISIIGSCKKDNSEPPAPFIGIVINNPIKTQPDTVNFTATSTIPSTYTWNFGDGAAEVNGETVTHIFDIGYYYVTLSAVTDANRSASIFKGVNTSKYRRAVINNIKLFQVPLTRSDGSPWETDGTKPDVYCEVSTGTRTGTTATITNADVGSGINLNLNFFTSFSDSLFDQPLVIKIYNANDSPIENDLIETVTLDKNLTELITNQEPYANFKTFQTTTVSGRLGFNWVQ